MDLSDRTDDYLIKTYCHLVKNMVPQNERNMRDFPPEEMWHGVRDALIKSITKVSKELANRNIESESLDCETLKL